jgi:GH24 family phage-related lysozyme (muramidase)
MLDLLGHPGWGHVRSSTIKQNKKTRKEKKKKRKIKKATEKNWVAKRLKKPENQFFTP